MSEIRIFSAATEDDEADGDVGDQALHVEGVKQSFVLFLPVGGHETFAGRSFELVGDHVGLIDVIDFEFDYGDEIAEAEQGLGVGEAGEGPGGVVVVEAGVENSYHAEAAVFRDHAEGRELALRAGDQDDGAYVGAEIVHMSLPRMIGGMAEMRALTSVRVSKGVFGGSGVGALASFAGRTRPAVPHESFSSASVAGCGSSSFSSRGRRSLL